MTSISSSVAPAETRATPRTSARNAALDRARTFLTLVVLVHHAVIPYTYFGHTDPKSWLGFDAIVLATDSFFMAMFFFLSGLFVWPGIARKGPLNYLSDCLPPVSAVTQHARSDQSPLAARSPSARRVLRGHACCHRDVLHSRADSLRSRQLVRVRAVLGPARPRDALCYLLLFRRRHRRSVFGSRAAGGRRPDGEGQLGLDDAGARSVLPPVGADLHQARNTGESGGVAGLV